MVDLTVATEFNMFTVSKRVTFCHPLCRICTRAYVCSKGWQKVTPLGRFLLPMRVARISTDELRVITCGPFHHSCTIQTMEAIISLWMFYAKCETNST